MFLFDAPPPAIIIPKAPELVKPGDPRFVTPDEAGIVMFITGSSRNYATWDPANKGSSITLSNGNLTATGTTAAWTNAYVRSSIGVTSGKHYIEVTVNDVTPSQLYWMYGCDNNGTWATNAGAYANSYGIQGGGGNFATGVTNNFSGTYPSVANTNIVMLALDRDNGRFYGGVNGTWANSGDPGAGTGYLGSGANMASGTWYFVLSMGNNGTQGTANFGATAFTHSVPSGFNSGLYT